MKSIPALLLTCSLTVPVVIAGGRAVAAEDQAAPQTIRLQPLKWTQFKDRLASAKGAKYTLVDVWATTCGPCKENFPHLVEMHKKFAGKGLAVISLSLDDPTDTKALAAAEIFLREQKAVFTNIVLHENYGDGYDKLDINTIPAVFIFSPDGKELKRFTMDDPDHQFTYAQVEKEVGALLASGSTAGSTAK
jgi:thiol-disulfide isomerase/thioredoxin